jgi:hypothetical protein
VSVTCDRSVFFRVLRFPPSNKTDRQDITEIVLKMTFNTINENNIYKIKVYCYIYFGFCQYVFVYHCFFYIFLLVKYTSLWIWTIVNFVMHVHIENNWYQMKYFMSVDSKGQMWDLGLLDVSSSFFSYVWAVLKNATK